MGDGEGVEEEGRDGMVYGGVTMGKCFYCMLLAPLHSPRRARQAALSSSAVSGHRALKYSEEHIYL